MLIILVLVLLPFFGSIAQTLSFKNFSTADGLLSDEVFNLHQDKHGYVWVFSKFGTLKYNGHEFKPVLKNLPDKEAFIYCIYENSQGQKWVANSKAHIFQIRNDSAIKVEGIEKISESLQRSVSEIVKLCVDDDSTIFAITKSLSYKFVKVHGKYKAVNLNSLIKTDSVFIKLFSVKNELLPVYNRNKNDEFIFWNNNKDIYVELPKTTEKVKINYLPYSIPLRNVKRFEQNILFSYSHFIGKINEKYQFTFKKVGSNILNYTKDKNNHTWVACLSNGLYELNENDSIINHYLENTTVNDVMIDHDNGLWLTTDGMGLFYCVNTQNHYFKPNEQLGGLIRFIKKLGDTLFIGGTAGDIYMLHKSKLSQLRNADNNSPMDIIRYGKNYILMLTFSVEQLLIGNNTKAKSLPLMPKTEKQYAVFALGTDTLIYTWRRGITYVVKGTPVKKIDFGRKITSSLLHGHTLWFGTEDGIFNYLPVFSKPGNKLKGVLLPDKDTLKEASFLQKAANSTIINCVADKNDNLWFCTSGDGIFKLSNHNLINYRSPVDLPDNNTNSITFKDNGSILLACSKGLFVSDSLSDKITSGTWKKLINGNVNQAVEFDNKVYLGSKNGLVILDNSSTKQELNKPYFHLASVLIGNKEVPLKSHYKINSNQNNLVFNFDLIIFHDTKPRIKYILQGPISDSGIVNRSITFNQLAPGSYVLKTFPYLKGGDTQTISVSFVVNPRYWQTEWFKALIIILLLSASSFISVLLVRKRQVKERLQNKNRQLIAEYKLIALKAQINPHFMSNCLSAIQHLILDNKAEKASQYIARFGLLVRQILDFSAKPVISLEEEFELLTIYVELEQLRFEHQFDFKIINSAQLDFSQFFIPPLLLNPIVENAIWHGLLPVQNKKQGKVEINLSKDETCITITITDNGVGRKKESFKALKNNTKYHGIAITEQRLQNLNALSGNQQAKMIFLDLEDENKQAIGTCVSVILPINIISIKDE